MLLASTPAELTVALIVWVATAFLSIYMLIDKLSDRSSGFCYGGSYQDSQDTATPKSGLLHALVAIFTLFSFYPLIGAISPETSAVVMIFTTPVVLPIATISGIGIVMMGVISINIFMANLVFGH